jgi:hypothetical protein
MAFLSATSCAFASYEIRSAAERRVGIPSINVMIVCVAVTWELVRISDRVKVFGMTEEEG